ncbi:MAG: hypothetical protein H7276_03880 [Caulobacter sp.]|nr:hypothetical protein [Vitreoscilla sp.]
MSNSNADRVDDTLDFMTVHGAGILAGQIRGALTTDLVRDQAGAYIKVDARIKTDTDRARQALLLCRHVFVERRALGAISDWGVGCFGSKNDLMTHWAWKTTATIMNGVRAYERLAVPGCLAGALERLGRNPGRITLKYHDMSRQHHRNLGSPTTPICYQTITLALWISGHASLPWLATWYASSNAGNCFDLMGNGNEIDDVNAVLDLRGQVISFRNKTRMGAQYVNHWAIITGGGRAIGSNTDGFEDAGAGNGASEFLWGDRSLHEFDIAECLQACTESTKYRDAGGVRVALHPTGNMNLW